MSRFAVDPRWLVYLPPTMSPAPTSTRRRVPGAPGAGVRGVRRRPASTRVVCEEKHMGSRAIAVIARDEDAAERRFGVGRRDHRASSTRAPAARSSPTTRARPGRPAPAARGAAVRVAGDRLAGARLRAAALVGEGDRADQGAVRLGRRGRPARPAGGAGGPGPGRGRSWAGRRRPDGAQRHGDRATPRRSATRTRRTAVRPTDSTASRSRRSRSSPARGAPSRSTEPHALAPRRARRSSTATLITPTRHRFVDLADPPQRRATPPTGGSSSPQPAVRAWSSSRPHLTEGARAARAEGARPGVPADHLRARLHRLAGPSCASATSGRSASSPSASTASAWRR